MRSARSRRFSGHRAHTVWLLPVVLFGAGVTLAVVMMRLDRQHGWLLLDFSPGGAQSFLGALSGALVSFVGIVFSVVTLAIQFAAGSLSPRLLAPLLESKPARYMLGVSMFTLGYSLALLLRVEDRFVPQAAIIVSLPFMAASFFGFVVLIDSVGRGLRFASVYAHTLESGLRAVRRVFPEPFTPGCEDELASPVASASRIVAYRGESGVIQDLARAWLLAEARRADGAIVLLRAVGDYIYSGTPLFRVSEAARPVRDELLHRTVVVGRERRVDADPGYALRLLVDIAERALSPAVNDPTTAVGCLDHLEVLLHELGHRRLSAGLLADEHGTLRVQIPMPAWRDYVSLACDEIRFYGTAAFQVTRRLKAMLEDLIAALPEERRAPLAHELAVLEREVPRRLGDSADQRRAWVADRQGLGAPEDHLAPH